MGSMRLPRSSLRFASAIALAALLAIGAVAMLQRRKEAAACGWSPPEIGDLTAFDPGVARDSHEGLFYDPLTVGFGPECADCMARDLVREWLGYLGRPVTSEDWSAVLFDATDDELAGIAARLADSSHAAPERFSKSSLWKAKGRTLRRLRSAIPVIVLARAVGASASLGSGDEPAPPRPSDAVLERAKAGLAESTDKFIRQRYAFAVIRILFYQREFASVVDFFDRNAGALSSPARSLLFRARYYTAGALMRTGRRARANLELARVAAGYPALSGPAAKDFQPMEDRDWKQSLRLASSDLERTELWWLAGIRLDGLVAMKEIFAIDPRSKLLALLALRELARIEASASFEQGSPDTAASAVYGRLETIVADIAATPGADRVWLMDLVAGHLAAVRGDLAHARQRLERARAARPDDPRVAAQVRASMALALAHSWTIDPGRESELAAVMASLGDFPLAVSVQTAVRRQLARAYAAAGNSVEAEFLFPNGDTAVGPRGDDVALLTRMIERAHRTATEWDRFVLSDSYSSATLERALARHHVRDGDFSAAARVLAKSSGGRDKLGTDPFQMRIVDCHDCDHELFRDAPWTYASFAARLVKLRKAAQGKGERAAQASIDLGNALYNLTWYGNARVVMLPSFEEPGDTAAAERWFARAFKLSKNPELKAKAAYLAAKAELGSLLTAAQAGNPEAMWNPVALPTPKRWFTALAKLSSTAYYAEVLAECGHFRAWVESSP